MYEHDTPCADDEDEDGEPAGTGGRALPSEAERGVLVWLRRVGRRLGISSDEAAFRKLYEQHKHSIWACVNGRGISQATARDLFQEVCVITARRPEGLPDPVMPYVRDIVKKLKANLRRQQRPEVEVSDALPASRPGAEQRFASSEIVETALAQMKPLDAWIIRMIDLVGESYENVAKELGCSEQNAVLRHHRAKVRFKALAEPLYRAALEGES